MNSLDVIHKLRQRLHATAAAKPNQWHTGVAMLRFLALMLLLTLLVRGTAATTLPVVSVTAPYQGVVTQSFTVSGQISPGIGTPLTIPEGAAVSLPLAHGSCTRLRAFLAGAASGLVEPLGAVLAFVLAEWGGAALPWLMSAAAGCMVCVTAQEMIPEAVEPDEVAGVISIVLGFALMMALDVAL